MSSGQQGCWTVRPAEGRLTPELREAMVALRYEWDIPQARDERIPSVSGVKLKTNAFRYVVWEEETEAQKFADELAERTRSEWEVIPTHCDEP